MFNEWFPHRNRGWWDFEWGSVLLATILCLPLNKGRGDLGNATLEPRQYPWNKEFQVLLRVFIGRLIAPFRCRFIYTVTFLHSGKGSTAWSTTRSTRRAVLAIWPLASKALVFVGTVSKAFSKWLCWFGQSMQVSAQRCMGLTPSVDDFWDQFLFSTTRKTVFDFDLWAGQVPYITNVSASK
jgi:hypothetical protein